VAIPAITTAAHVNNNLFMSPSLPIAVSRSNTMRARLFFGALGKYFLTPAGIMCRWWSRTGTQRNGSLGTGAACRYKARGTSRANSLSIFACCRRGGAAGTGNGPERTEDHDLYGQADRNARSGHAHGRGRGGDGRQNPRRGYAR